MVKSTEEVIAQFNKRVNMTDDELQQWLDDPKSEKAGTGVGIESGHKIIEILKKNPDKDPKKYDEEDIQHMRKVAGYLGRHLAQEGHLKETKTKEELENTKSTISLKNWAHDPIKTLEGDANEDDAKASDVEEKSRKTGDDKETRSKEKSQNASEPAEVAGSKRKQPADDEGEVDAEDPETSGDVRENDGEASIANGDDGDDVEERARKKSKTSEEDSAEVEHAGEGTGDIEDAE